MKITSVLVHHLCFVLVCEIFALRSARTHQQPRLGFLTSLGWFKIYIYDFLQIMGGMILSTYMILSKSILNFLIDRYFRLQGSVKNGKFEISDTGFFPTFSDLLRTALTVVAFLCSSIYLRGNCKITCFFATFENSTMTHYLQTWVLLPPFRNTCPISLLSRGNSGILPKRHMILIELNESYS